MSMEVIVTSYCSKLGQKKTLFMELTTYLAGLHIHLLTSY